MKVKALLKNAIAWIASFVAVGVAFVLAYCGSLVLLGQFMYDDWRILFIAFFPALFVAGLVGMVIDGE